MYSWVQAGLCGFMPLSYYSRSGQEAAQWTAPTSCALLGQRKSYDVLVYMFTCLHVGISQLLQSDYLHYLRLAL
jgi:hypothetical protein